MSTGGDGPLNSTSLAIWFEAAGARTLMARRRDNELNWQLFAKNKGASVIYRSAFVDVKNGTPDRDRTCDPLLRRQLLYPTELRALQGSIQKPSTFFFNAKDSRIEFFALSMMKNNVSKEEKSEPDV